MFANFAEVEQFETEKYLAFTLITYILLLLEIQTHIM